MNDSMSEFMLKKVIVNKTGEIGTITGIDSLVEKYLVDLEKGGSEWVSLDEFSLYNF